MKDLNTLQKSLPNNQMIEIYWSGNDGEFKYSIIDCETMRPLCSYETYEDLYKHINRKNRRHLL